MAIQETGTARSSATTNLAEILERVLDKGIVIAGDIKLSLGEVEILTLQIRLVICSVDKAKAMGMDWWTNHPAFSPYVQREKKGEVLERIEERLERLEGTIEQKPERQTQRRSSRKRTMPEES